MLNMKFIADSMLGRLARWMRLSGYDAAYARSLSDAEIIESAKSGGRILLSRDAKLCEKAGREDVDAVIIKSTELQEQLRQLVAERGIVVRDSPEFARCAACNGEIEKINKEEAAHKIPEKVLERIDEFWACKDCGKIYWHGGHWKKIKEQVQKIGCTKYQQTRKSQRE